MVLLNFAPQSRPAIQQFAPSLSGSAACSHKSLSLFLARDPKNVPITPFLAISKSLDFNSFRCHAFELPRGARHKLLARNLESELHPARRERGPRVRPHTSFFHGSQTGSAQPSNPTPTLSFHALTTIKSCNPFVLTFIQNAGGVYPPSPLFQAQSSVAATASQRPEVLFSFHTVNCQLSTDFFPTSHEQ